MRIKEDTQKHTLHLFTGDFEKLQALHPAIGASKIIRTLVHRYVEQVESGTVRGDELRIDGVSI